MNIAAAGVARVAILDEQDNAFPGYSVGECDPIQSDSIRYVVTWGGNNDVSPLAGQLVRLRLEMENCQVFAFQFRGD
jgi:hypothetical protein